MRIAVLSALFLSFSCSNYVVVHKVVKIIEAMFLPKLIPAFFIFSVPVPFSFSRLARFARICPGALCRRRGRSAASLIADDIGAISTQ